MSPIPSPDPLAGGRRHRWAAALLKLAGWQIEMTPPPVPRSLLLLYPHTSYWDFAIAILVKWSIGWPASWIAKHTVFRGPLARILRSWGGIPVNRRAPGGFVREVAEKLTARETVILVIAPEGTRRYQPHWKAGFMRIALTANMPVGLMAIDYKTRRITLSEYLWMTGDEEADMARIAAGYEGVVGRNPSLASPIRLN
ncbi:1-acyl-sn-glycerol-3-phosphate acyltransferase [Niveibacterium terrae]|uniref:1-acyl-sn-glycerol-3-phosphate acyltransferase n=1 Tax=Niveibacterium terrae TaxID=3373598 RepID=UPI003A8D55AA